MPPSPQTLWLAPLRGVTGLTFRQCLTRHFGHLDGAVSPFLTTVAGVRIKATHLTDIEPARNQALALVPQVIGKSSTELRTLLLAIRGLGYARCDLNAGCPWPMIVKKGRGAGLLRDADALRRMLDTGCALMPGGFSIKVRLGIESSGLLLERMDLLNGYPLREVTIHARTARQRYEGHVDLDGFAAALQACRHPVCYNGDIRTAADLAELRRRFPAVSGWMIGRGIIADPFLPGRIRGDPRPVAIERLRAFLDDFGDQSAHELSGPAPLLGRLKELWSYLHARFVDGPFLWRQIRTSRHPDDYRRILDDWWGREPQLVEITEGIKPPGTSA
ncbi:MAG: tRNA-dihydrouridine synthase family protein [Lentisphaerae bacterium]|nr:tRNA-dihydrouridine synthase family protein [Lentisphaerota bacterium]